MKRSLYYLVMLLVSSSCVNGALAELRSFPHVGHLALGVAKLAASAVSVGIGMQTLMIHEETKGYVLTEVCARLIKGEEKLFSEAPLFVNPAVLGATSFLSFSGISFFAAYKLLLSANDSFRSVYQIEEKQPNVLEEKQPSVEKKELNGGKILPKK